ncbi:hypothetical protein [Burkholderia sp. Ac-20365]|uniref:hypothetical protein n=1 Tax=Burkholderia sp. Ac-20365 TaxID=2703897 RepID=UPI00197C2228|nr:hypothetical protein [Burkholderia sp. Ac-20365]MBN3760743.1 hypothetical protein [Burkholderia sp. Ac-20365]
MILPLPPNARGCDDHGLDQQLQRCARLVDAAAPVALALDELGDIALPLLPATRFDQAQLRVLASLYLASELEMAGVVDAVEALAGLGRGAGLGVDLGAAAALIAQYWRGRNERATPDERRACFDRVFGVQSGFDEAMLEVCEALYRLDENEGYNAHGGVAVQARVRAAAVHMAEQLVGASSGTTVFIAQDLLQNLRQSLAILGHPALRGAFGARDLWSVLVAIDRFAHTAHGDARIHFRRGRAGMTVLAWLAEVSAHMSDMAAAFVALDHPVIGAAVEWMQASLALGESATTARGTAPPAAAPVNPRAPSESPWAAMAG